MKSLIKFTQAETKLCEVPTLLEPAPNEVLIQVKSVGLCRTDLFVSNGNIPLNYDIVLGHEFSGVIVKDPSKTYSIGQHVAVNPLYINKKFMGVDFNGALTEFISVPLGQVIATSLHSFKVSSYVEPVAASMAVLKANINKEQKGGVYGNNRIAQLTFIILQSFGYNIEWLDENKIYENDSYDYIVETLFEEKHLQIMLSLLKDNGLLIVKSRKKQAVGINPSLLVSKEICLQSVNYYDFHKTMKWLEENFSQIDCLLGESYHIDDWQAAFSKAMNGESKKIFIHF